MLSDQLTAKQGPLSRVWLASHWERKISKAQFLHTNLNTAIEYISNNQTQEPIALRISGQLLLGVVRIHSRKTRYLLEDCNGALSKIKTAFKQGNVNLAETTNTKANLDTITLPERLDDFDILLPDTPWSREQMARDPMLDSLLTQDITLLDTQDTYLSFNDAIEQGRLLDRAEHQHVSDFGTLPMDDIEMGRRDNEAALLDRSFSAELGDGSLNKLQQLQLNDKDDGSMNQDDGFDFDFGFGDDNNDDAMNRDVTPLPEFQLASQADDNMDSLMEAGIVPVSENEQIIFGMDDDNSIQQTPRRRRRLVVDKVTEIPAEELKRYILDTSAIIDKTANDDLISTTTTKATKKIDLKKPSACIAGSEIEIMVTRWNRQQRAATLNASQDAFDRPATTPYHNAFGQQDDGVDFDFGDFGGDDHGAIDTPMDQGNIFDTGMSFNEDDMTDDQSPAYDTQQATFGTRTKETIDRLQQTFHTQKSIAFDQLADKGTAKKADAARLFFDVLLLTTKNVIKVNQTNAYGPIEIRA